MRRLKVGLPKYFIEMYNKYVLELKRKEVDDIDKTIRYSWDKKKGVKIYHEK